MYGDKDFDIEYQNFCFIFLIVLWTKSNPTAKVNKGHQMSKYIIFEELSKIDTLFCNTKN